MGALLLVLAHPDDECFGAGASAACYAKEGRRVALATLTRGGGGLWQGAPQGERPRLTEVRAKELAESARTLGVDPLYLLDYPDGSLAWLQLEQQTGLRSRLRRLRGRRLYTSPPLVTPRGRLIADLVRIMHTVEAEVIITHGPEGRDGHPDHRATCELVLAAAGMAIASGSGPRKVYCEVAPADAVARLKLPRPLLATTQIAVGDHQGEKREAFRRHVTQSHERDRVEMFIGAQGAHELFALVEGELGPQHAAGFETDLFA